VIRIIQISNSIRVRISFQIIKSLKIVKGLKSQTASWASFSSRPPFYFLLPCQPTHRPSTSPPWLHGPTHFTRPAPQPETPALGWMRRCSPRATGCRPLSRPHVHASVASISRRPRVCPRFCPNAQLPSFAWQPQSPRESRRKVYPQPRFIEKSSINPQRTLKEILNSVGIWIQGIVPRPP
jgi:hypothetical protein